MSNNAPCAGFSLSKGRRSSIRSSTTLCLSCRPGAGGEPMTLEAARERYAGVFSDSELRFLTNQADSYGWYAATGETQDLIQALCTRGLMAANGDFKVCARAAGSFPSRERERRSGESPRYYELIGEGCRAFHALYREADADVFVEPLPA